MISKFGAKRIFSPKNLALVFLIIAISGCSKPQNDYRPTPGGGDPILKERLAKDEAFKSDQSSPIPEKDRAAFHGLSYYPVDPKLRFSAVLHRYSAPKQVRLSTNTGDIRQ